jgi:hypothetical protein
VGLLLLPPLAGRAEAKAENEPIQMPNFEITEFAASVEIRPAYRNTPDGPRLVELAIETVRPHTAAARIGLKPGMEITRLDGKDVIGMTPEQYDLLLRGPFWNSLTLKVKIPRPFHRPVFQEFRIPLPGASAVKPPPPTPSTTTEKLPEPPH